MMGGGGSVRVAAWCTSCRARARTCRAGGTGMVSFGDTSWHCPLEALDPGPDLLAVGIAALLLLLAQPE